MTFKALALSLIALFVATSANAAKPRAEDLAEQFKESKQNLEETEAQKRKILGSLYQINKRMKKISHDKGQLIDQMMVAQANVKSLAQLIAVLENQIKDQRIQLRKRLRALYKLSGEGYLATIFSQTSGYELDRMLRFIKTITDQDYKLIQSYQENVDRHKKRRRELDRSVQKLVKIESRIKSQETLLASEHRAKSNLVSDLDASKMRAMSRIGQLRRESKKLGDDEVTENNLLDLLKPSFYEQKAQLLRPLDGRLVQDFGLMIDEKFKTQISHKGWHLEAKPGTPFQAVFEGRVAYLGWIPGYGQLMMIDHGDHYYTIYAHASRFTARLEETVKRGQVIGYSGISSRQFGPGLYFEIRHFSEPENPSAWIDTKKMPIAENKKNADVARAAASVEVK